MADASDRLLVETALALNAVCNGRATFLVHRRLDVALAAGADGVRLEADGFPLREAHNIINKPGFLIALDASSEGEARQAMRGGASFICFGPVAEVGMRAYVELCSWIDVPTVPFGGVGETEIFPLAAAGAAAIALDAELLRGPNGAALVRRAVETLRRRPPPKVRP
jgi:thiamine monophosphate synthase